MLRIETNNPIAITSNDHLHPDGIRLDNWCNPLFVDQLEDFIKYNMNKNKINYIDIGCAGGALAVEMLNRGHLAIGIDGSDYALHDGRENWTKYHNKNFFTADLSHPWKIMDDDKRVKFDIITAWEVMEHFMPDSLDTVLETIHSNLDDKGYFICSIALFEMIKEDVKYHHSVFPIPFWQEKLSKYFYGIQYPFSLDNRPFGQTLRYAGQKRLL